VRNIISDPGIDPHAYEPTAADAVSFATARLAIVNGAGYDRWASALLAAGADPRRRVLDAARLLGRHEGENPHLWYSPPAVLRVAERIAAELAALAPADRSYFMGRLRAFRADALSRYLGVIAAIRRRFAGVPVGYSESIFEPLGQALGLRLLTPHSFAKAIAEGTDVSADDKQTVDAQAQRRQIKVWIYNSQNATPDVQRVNALARAAGIPVTTVTETLSPASASFEQWQVAELISLQRALHQATGR
jgi:zinc/manganese transport system substrate-binding protein